MSRSERIAATLRLLRVCSRMGLIRADPGPLFAAVADGSTSPRDAERTIARHLEREGLPDAQLIADLSTLVLAPRAPKVP